MDRRNSRDREFREFVDARALVMRRTAFLLCGDWHRAEDIVQTALTKLYVAWSRVRKDSVDAYARKVLVRTAIDEGRRGFFQRERSVDAVPERPAVDQSTDLDLRLALDALPPGQRAVVVLRYWEDLSITETARILGRTEGTVKSQAAKGLAALRELLVDEPQSRIYASDVIRKGKTKLARRRTAIAGALVFALLAGLGTAGYLARPQQTSGASSAYSADSAAELARVLRDAGVIPAGVSVQDVPEIPARALEVFERDQRRWAAALLKDGNGTSALAISLYRAPSADVGTCAPSEVSTCEIGELNGVKIRSNVVGDRDGVHAFEVRAYRPDGTYLTISSINVSEFLPNLPATPNWGAPVTRPTPVLDSGALIKIATLPGLTF